jgi:type I site-specific restriction-modification system R (restriction) subunit
MRRGVLRGLGHNRELGEAGLTEDELAFYDMLETNDSGVRDQGEETLRAIARELVETVRNSLAIDRTLRENVYGLRSGCR